MNHTYTLGDPHTVVMDLSSKTVNITLEKTDTDLLDLWAECFRPYPEITLCLSGGIDSQFSANLASRFCNKVNAVTFAFLWDNCVINADDLVMAQRFSQQQKLHHEVIEVDLRHFFDTQMSDVASRYRTGSPQIASHLYGIEKFLAHRGTAILMGGEVPLMAQKQGIAVMPYRWPTANTGSFSHTSLFHYMRMILPYAILAKQTDAPIIRDPFMMSPKIYYQSFMKNLEVIGEHKVIFDIDEPMQSRPTDYKNLYYKSFGFDYIVPLKKHTGFEQLKTHLAMKTGVYNEFDKRYRTPLNEFSVTDDSLGKPVFTDDSNKILELHQYLIDSEKPRACNNFNFDW